MVSIIIANWNGKKWLPGCLQSVLDQAYKDLEIIIVDNNSNDGSVEFIENNYPAVRLIKNEKNEGFGKASNIGAASANGDVLFFLNNDTLMNDNAVGELLREKEARKINIIGPKILNFQKEDTYQGRRLSMDCTGYLGWGKETFFVEGSALMISKKDFEALGGFDEKYFMYSEDIDLCWRAQLQGMKVAICDGVSIVHFGGGSSESTQLAGGARRVVPISRRYEVEKNNLRNVLKNYRWLNLGWILPYFFAQNFGEAAIYLATGNFKMARAMVKAIWWNISNISDTMAKRREIQVGRKLGDWKILAKINFWPNKIQALWVAGWPKFK